LAICNDILYLHNEVSWMVAEYAKGGEPQDTAFVPFHAFSHSELREYIKTHGKDKVPASLIPHGF